MLIELLSISNYGNYNIKLANIVGLEMAVYINELINLNEKATRKGKLVDNFFNIERKYIQDRTTFSPTKQKDMDDALEKIGIIKKNEVRANSVSLDLGVLTTIMMSPNEELIKRVSKIGRASTKKVTEEERKVDFLKGSIITSDSEFRNAYYGWIEGVYQKGDFLTTTGVTYGQRLVDTFSNGNREVALRLIEIAAVNGYREMQWAVDAYKKQYNVTSIKSPSQMEQPRATRRVGEIF